MYEIDKLLKEVKRVHFIGIGGSGMCPLAEILHNEGYKLSGSDNNETDTLARIRSMGIPVTLGQKAENINGAEMIIYTAALLPDNPELVAAKASDIPTFERAELLGSVTRMYSDCYCVCGTHGKTTVSSMLTQIMIQCDKDPSAVIGGKLPLTQSNGRVGKTQNMVCEACEFKDTFLRLSPDIAIILNVDADHLEYFKTIDNIILSFNKFSKMATKALIINGDDQNTLKAVSDINDKRIITFGLDKKNDFYADNIVIDHAFAGYDIYKKGEKVGSIKLKVPGEHNIYNSLAALAAADYAGIDIDKAINSLEQFGGACRRFEILAEIDGITIADDYAHHPAELKVTLDAAMQMEYNTVWAVFQPFTYSRTKEHMDDFAKVLQIPDKCVMTEIMGSREVNTDGVYTSQLAEKIPGSVWYDTFDEVADHILAHVKPGDLVITLGCGDVYKIAKIIINKLNNK